MFFRPTRLRIDLSALEQNYRKIKDIAGPDRQVCAVVKANGYGMGAVALARHLERANCDCFGVATLKEAVELRQAGVKKPVILLGALYGRDSLWEALLLDLEISIHHLAAMEDLASLTRDELAKLSLHLKVNTGMSRLGLQESEIPVWCQKAKELGIKLKGVFTTFSSSDQGDNPRTLEQIEVYERILAALKSEGFDPPQKHIANSGAILNFPESLMTMVRPGLLLHGVSSWPNGTPEGFQNIARLESEIVQISKYEAGTPFGYSASKRVERHTIAGVIPIGYADGLNRRLSNKGEVLIRGQRVPIIGKISMDLTIVDLTDLEEAKLGDKVTILGKDGHDEITPWEMANLVDGIPWEVFCWIGPRVPRMYYKSDEE